MGLNTVRMQELFPWIIELTGEGKSQHSRILNLRKKNSQLFSKNPGLPLGLENLGNGRAFSSQGILNRLEESGEITQNTGKLREFEINIIWYF